MLKITTISVFSILFSMPFISIEVHAEATSKIIAKIGHFSVVQEDCDVDSGACDYNLYEDQSFRLPLVAHWERGLNLEEKTSEFLRFSYGYTFNLHHSIFVSKEGIVQALDEVLAVDQHSGCIARYDRETGIPTLYFQKVFNGKIQSKKVFNQKNYPQLNQNLLMPNDYFLEPQFNQQGDFRFVFEYQPDKEVVIEKPCAK